MTWMRRAVGPLVAMIVMLALAGCSGDDPEPKIAPTPSSPATSASPSLPSPRGTPHEAMTPIGTIRAWVEAQNRALRTGDTSELSELGASSCRGCDNFVEPIDEVYAAGGSYSTEGWTFVKGRVRPNSENPVTVDVGVSLAGGETVLSAGDAPVIYSPEKHIMVFKLVPDGNLWLISFIGFIS